MNVKFFATFICFCGLLLAGCGKPAAQVAPPPATEPNKTQWFYVDFHFTPYNSELKATETISFYEGGVSGKPVECMSLGDVLNELSWHGWLYVDRSGDDILVKRAKPEDAPNFQILPGVPKE